MLTQVLEMAVTTDSDEDCHPSKRAGLIFHKGRGSQYASKDFRDFSQGVWNHSLHESAWQLLGQRLQRDAVRFTEDEALAWAAICEQAPRKERNHRMATLV